MTTHKGNSGVVKVDDNAVSELTQWQITEQAGTAEDTALGDTARTYLSDDLPSFSGSMQGHFYPGDTTGQAVIVAGATLSGEFASEGTATGKNKFSGSIIITNVQVGDVANGQVVPWSAQFQGSGPLTRGSYS